MRNCYNCDKFRAENDALDAVKADPLKRWLYLFQEAYKDEREMEVLTDMSEGLKVYAKKYNRSIDDPKLRDLYEYEMSARRDEATIKYEAEMGGYMRQLATTIKNLLAMNMPLSSIYQATGAPKNDVDEIIKAYRSKGL